MFLRLHMTVGVYRVGIQCRELERVRLRRTGLYASAWEGLAAARSRPSVKKRGKGVFALR